jgi:uncharacterized protein (TIGR02996 family)
MSPDNPFLKALIAQPDDDTLRLAMADWLDENDQAARAEFVRLQCELARGVGPERRRELEVRQRELLVAHDAEWTRPLAEVLGCGPGEWGGWVFRRGFVEYFHLPATAVNKRGAQLAALTPVRELFLVPCKSGNVIALCNRPWLERLTALYLTGRLNENATRALMDCPYLGNLRCLDATPDDTVREATRRAFDARFAAVRRTA